MGKLRDNFAGRGPSPEQLYKEAQMAGTSVHTYARFVCKDIMGINRNNRNIIKGAIEERIMHAAPKSVESMRRKARDNYDNDTSRIKDGARLTIFTDHTNPKEMDAILGAFGDNFRNHPFNKDMQEKGYSFVERNDYITNPKRWGYMAMYMVLEVDGTKFEVQIYPECMKETYDKTHQLYEMARESGNLERWENACKKALAQGERQPPMSEHMTYGEIALMQEILHLHKTAAEKAGLMKYVNKFPELDDLPPIMVERDIEQYPQFIKHPHQARPAQQSIPDEFRYDA
jgi:hypothetical protein